MSMKQLLILIVVLAIGAALMKDGFNFGPKVSERSLQAEANTLISHAEELTAASKMYKMDNRTLAPDAATLVTEGYVDRIQDDLVLSVTAPYEGSAESIGFVSPELCLIIHNQGTGSNDTSLVPDGDLDLTAPYDCIEDGLGKSVLVYF